MHIFGPVASRRLGLSLGVDLIGKTKTCDLNCIYCELGRTTRHTSERKIFVKTRDIIDDLKNFLKKEPNIDFITISGNGEPTLALNLGEVIDEIKKITDIKVAVLTNGTLLFNKKVRNDLKNADLVLPSLDAGTEKTFLKINRPVRNLNFKKIIKGLIDFSKEYRGKIWLEIMLVKNINDNEKEIIAIKKIIDKLYNIEKIQLNTVVRAGAEKNALPISQKKLNKFKRILGNKAEIIANFIGKKITKTHNLKKQILNIIRLRPVTFTELKSSIKENSVIIKKNLKELINKKKIIIIKHNNKIFYKGK